MLGWLGFFLANVNGFLLARAVSSSPIIASPDEVNTFKLKSLDGRPVPFEAEDDIADLDPEDRAELECALDHLCPRVLLLKVGAPVRLTHVRNSRGLHRGMEGTVKAFEDGWPVVQLKNGARKTFKPCLAVGVSGVASRRQVPLALAWATTLHKAQGMTLQQAAIHVSHVFEENMGYVALSRVSTRAGLKLLDRLSKMTYENLRCWVEKKLLSVSPKALEFHLKLLEPTAQVRIRQGQRKFQKLLGSDRFQAVLESAGFEEGRGYDYDYERKSYPKWAIREYGDRCYNCGKSGHWRDDCMERQTLATID